MSVAVAVDGAGEVGVSVDARQCKELAPALDISDRPRFPIFGGMFHPPGGIVRYDAVVWGLARGASKLGAHIHQGTAVTGIGVQNGMVAWVDTDRGRIRTTKVLNAAGAYSAGIAFQCLGQRLPISVLTIQAMVTQPLKPLLTT